MVRRILRSLLIGLAFVAILFSVLLNLARVIVPAVGNERNVFELWASHVLHQPVAIHDVKTYWRDFAPELRFDNVVVYKWSNHQPLLRIRQLGIGISIWKSIWQWRLVPNHLFITGTNLNMYRNANGVIDIDGITDFTKQSQTNVGKFHDLLIWLLTQTNIDINQVSVDFSDSSGLHLPIHNIRIRVINSLLAHKIDGAASLRQLVPTRFRFNVRLANNFLSDNNYHADFYFQAKNLVLQQWLQATIMQPWLGNFVVHDGLADVAAWATWQNGHLQGVKAKVNASDVGLLRTDRKMPQPLFLNHVAANVAWLLQAHGYQVTADQMHVMIDGHVWPIHRFGYQRLLLPKLTVLQTFYLDQLPLAHLSEYWHTLFSGEPGKFKNNLFALKPTGKLQNVYLKLTHKADKFQWSTEFDFKHLGFHALYGLGAKNLTGVARLKPDQGSVLLQSHAGELRLPNWFQQPLAYQQLLASIFWQKTSNGLQVALHHLYWDDGNLSLQGGVRLLKTHAGKPKINALLAMHMLHLQQFKNYVPSSGVGPLLREWLCQVFDAGVMPSATLVVENNQPQFLAHAENVDLHYLLGWPNVTHASGNLFINGHSLMVHSSHALIVGNPLRHIQAHIKNFFKPALIVQGDTQTTAGQALAFFKKIPQPITKKLQNINVSGLLQMHFGLQIPLLAPGQQPPKIPKPITLSAITTFLDNYIQLPAWHVTLQHVIGHVLLHDKHIESDDLIAEFMHHPLYMTVSNVGKPNGSGAIHLHARGMFTSNQLDIHYPELANYLEGNAPFYLDLMLYGDASQQKTQLELQSSLQGLGIKNLPPDLVKAAAETLPLHLSLKLLQKRSTVQLNFAKHLSVAAELRWQQNHWLPYSINCRLGGESAQLMQQPGMIIDGRLETFNGQVWAPYIKKLSQFLLRSRIDAPIKLKYLAVYIAKLQLWQQQWYKTLIGLRPVKSGYQLAVHNAKIAGTLTIPAQTGAVWQARLQRFYMPKLSFSSGVSKNAAASLAQLPKLQMYVDNFHYGQLVLGSMLLKLHADQQHLHLDEFAMHNPYYGFKLAGTWQFGAEQTTSLNASMQAQDFGRVLMQMGWPNILANTNGKVEAQLRWHGDPAHFNAATLKGRVKLDLSDGSILTISNTTQNELGFARLLNILSLQSILNKLTFHFGDLTNHGFDFSRFRGSLRLESGDAYTHNVEVDGPTADVLMHGRIGFTEKDYNLYLTIRPYYTASVPVIVGLIGGPLAGAISWVANKIFSPVLGRIAEFKYHIDGHWKKPHIEKMHMVQLPKPAGVMQR